jgi:hypothetical protein
MGISRCQRSAWQGRIIGGRSSNANGDFERICDKDGRFADLGAHICYQQSGPLMGMLGAKCRGNAALFRNWELRPGGLPFAAQFPSWYRLFCNGSLPPDGESYSFACSSDSIGSLGLSGVCLRMGSLRQGFGDWAALLTREFSVVGIGQLQPESHSSMSWRRRHGS